MGPWYRMFQRSWLNLVKKLLDCSFGVIFLSEWHFWATWVSDSSLKPHTHATLSHPNRRYTRYLRTWSFYWNFIIPFITTGLIVCGFAYHVICCHVIRGPFVCSIKKKFNEVSSSLFLLLVVLFIICSFDINPSAMNNKTQRPTPISFKVSV